MKQREVKVRLFGSLCVTSQQDPVVARCKGCSTLAKFFQTSVHLCALLDLGLHDQVLHILFARIAW